MNDKDIEKILSTDFGHPQWNYASTEMKQFAVEGFKTGIKRKCIMTTTEKSGLLLAIFGLVMIAALLVLGNGDITKAMYHGETPLSPIFPLACFALGSGMFILGGNTRND